MTKEHEVNVYANSIIDLKQIQSVYSGKNGKCCCGCAGKHTYASAHRAAASKNRGYEITDNEISDRSVKLIVDKIIALSKEGKVDMIRRDFISAVNDDRLYIAYFLKD